MWRGADGGGKFCIYLLFIFWIPSCDGMTKWLSLPGSLAFFSLFTIHDSLLYILLVVSFEFKKFFVLCGNNVIKTILRNVDIGNVIFPPVQEVRQDHPIDGLMADNHNIIRAPV